MKKAILSSLTEPEWLLVRESEPAELLKLDEDELLALHTRVQRARTKYVTLYRRGASAAVSQRGGRGFSHAKNQRARDKAEVFETVLARVSRQVGVVAGKASAELRAERIAAARATAHPGPGSQTSAGSVGGSIPSPRRAAVKTTGGLKRDASSRAQDARRQAARDGR